MVTQKIKAPAVLSFLIIIFIVCAKLPQNPESSNPLDRNNPDYIPPSLTISNLPDTINQDSISLSWIGNEQITQTKFYLKERDTTWSPWDTISTYLYKNLDEIEYHFYLAGKYPNGDSVIDSISFTINSITSKALFLFPQIININSPDTSTIYIQTENIPDFNAAKVSLGFSKDCFEVISIQKSPELTELESQLLFFSTSTDSSILIELGASNSLSNIQSIAKIKVFALTNTSSIHIEKANCIIRTQEQEEVNIDYTRGTTLTAD